jgi:sirohydrochlorin cobaltochelatase
MIVAGDHANNDMAGDEEDSWKSILQEEGYTVQPVLRGLGQYPGIQAMFVRHAGEAVAGL